MIEYKNYYFVGIGGIGMSAIARMLQVKGAIISGSDLAETEVVKGLKSVGMKINLNQVAENLPDDIDCVVYTIAVSKDNPELVEAKKRGLPIYTYAEMLGKLSSDFKTIAVSGTHGKTTTTAMSYSAFVGSGRKPHLIVGSLLSSTNSNYLKGEEDILITEACEYNRSFLDLNPEHLIITNIEADHLDYYKDLADIQSAFIALAEKLPEGGKIICDPSLPNLSSIVEKFADNIIDYTKFISEVPTLKVLGQHNILNAACALALTSIFELDLSGAQKGLAEFTGTWRRTEFKGQTPKGAILYDDYAHHPDEIRATLKALSEHYSDKKISVFFQPHLYSRTKLLLNDFVEALSLAHDINLLPIYAAREKNDPEISSETLALKLKETLGPDFSVEYLSNFADAAKKVLTKDENCVVVIMGAGDVYKIFDLI